MEVLPHLADEVIRDVTLRELKVLVGENYPTVGAHLHEMADKAKCLDRAI